MLNNARILIVRLSSIGDIMHTTPVAKALKEAYPACHITWIVGRTAAELIHRNPYVDEVVIWSREDFDHAAANRQVGQINKLWHQLKNFYQHHHFDLALDIHGLFLSGAIAYAGKIPRRIGMADTRELNRFFMTEQAPAVAPYSHVTLRYLSVLHPLGIHSTDCQMILQTTPQDREFADNFYRENNIKAKQPVLLVNPKTSWASKNWGNERFAKCLELLDPSIQIIMCGSKADCRDAEYIQTLTARPFTNAVAKTSLSELGALLERSTLLLSGDTGTLHLAAAVGTPTLSLWGPTRPEQYGPLGAAHLKIQTSYQCRACHKTKCRLGTNACMTSIAPSHIAAILNEKLLQ